MHFDFTWDGGDTFHPVGPKGEDGTIQVYIGPYDPTHDMYLFCPANCPYDAEEQVFELNPDWYVTGYGNQGMVETYFYIVELY